MRMKYFTTAVAVLAISMGTAMAQQKGRGRGRGPGIAPPIDLTVEGYKDGGRIPAKYTCAAGPGAAVSPMISWTGVPAGVQSFTLIMHDTDAILPTGEDILHWAIFDIPGTATSLPEHVPNTAELPDGAKQLNNIGRTSGFFGPCPPKPTAHHYIIELYGLDQKLNLPATASRQELMDAMKGHVRGKGTYVGIAKQ
jgi:Raf kinase inhibitor-like YbhB/YbcL family protein